MKSGVMKNRDTSSKATSAAAPADFILLSVLQNAINHLQMLGLQREELLRGTQFSSVVALDSKNGIDLIRHSELLVVFANAISLAKDPAIGLLYGLRAGVGVYGTLGYAMISAPTDLHAVNLVLKYQRLLLGELMKISLSIENNLGLITIDDAIADETIRRFYIEQIFAGVLRFNMAMTGKPVLLRALEFAYAEPEYVDTYRRIFACPLIFNATRNRIFFDYGVLSTTLPNSDPLTFTACERICQQIVERFEAQKSVTARTRELMIARWPELSSMDAIARNIGIDVRTLRRQLLEEGNSFSAVKDSVRRNIAIEYLQQTQLSIEEVSAALGFSAATGFRRAFRRWTGNYPSYYRQ